MCPLTATSPAGRKVAVAMRAIAAGANGSAIKLLQKAAQPGIMAFSSPAHPSHLFGSGISADMSIVIDMSIAPVPDFAPKSKA